MKRALAMLLLFAALPASAQVVVSTVRGIVVAHDGIIELYDSEAKKLWTAPGLEHPSAIATAADRVGVVDAWSNRVHIVDLRDGSGGTFATGETPVDALFAGDALFVLARDASALERIDRDGNRSATPVAADPLFVREDRGTLYVYSRRDGLLQEISPTGKLLRTANAGTFASDFELDGGHAYLLFPREARVAMISLDTLEIVRTASTGAVPTDLAITGRANALSAPRLAIADPASKRVWDVEGMQSVGAAFARGFIRGVLGLGLFRGDGAGFPHGVDRVASAGGVTVAFDSSSGTLYRIRRSKPEVVAQGIAVHAFAVTPDALAIWREGRLQIVR